MWYSTVKRFYDNGHSAYTNESLKTFVVAKMITPEQYEQITSIEYVA
ncbi:XkdX family protein [Mycolicibacterium fortuitum]|nr:XkdX family protein [Mycolicibacterium fortuitum]